MSDVAATPVSRREPTGSEFIAMRDSAKFGELRRTYRSFTFPMTVAFFVWYVVYVPVSYTHLTLPTTPYV